MLDDLQIVNTLKYTYLYLRDQSIYQSIYPIIFFKQPDPLTKE